VRLKPPPLLLLNNQESDSAVERLVVYQRKNARAKKGSSVLSLIIYQPDQLELFGPESNLTARIAGRIASTV
jgi:hypothetical protein